MNELFLWSIFDRTFFRPIWHSILQQNFNPSWIFQNFREIGKNQSFEIWKKSSASFKTLLKFRQYFNNVLNDVDDFFHISNEFFDAWFRNRWKLKLEIWFDNMLFSNSFTNSNLIWEMKHNFSPKFLKNTREWNFYEVISKSRHNLCATLSHSTLQKKSVKRSALIYNRILCSLK